MSLAIESISLGMHNMLIAQERRNASVTLDTTIAQWRLAALAERQRGDALQELHLANAELDAIRSIANASPKAEEA